jgi:hypothetical protein
MRPQTARMIGRSNQNPIVGEQIPRIRLHHGFKLRWRDATNKSLVRFQRAAPRVYKNSLYDLRI